MTAARGTPGITPTRSLPSTASRTAEIDYIFVGYPRDHGTGQVVTARVEATDPVAGVYPSDHHAVYAELRY